MARDASQSTSRKWFVEDSYSIFALFTPSFTLTTFLRSGCALMAVVSIAVRFITAVRLMFSFRAVLLARATWRADTPSVYTFALRTFGVSWICGAFFLRVRQAGWRRRVTTRWWGNWDSGNNTTPTNGRLGDTSPQDERIKLTWSRKLREKTLGAPTGASLKYRLGQRYLALRFLLQLR